MNRKHVVKSILSVMLTVAMIFGTVQLPFAPESVVVHAEPASGTCGENLTWSLDKQGTLTISGKGPMPDWDSDAAGKTVQPPWEPSLVENVVIEDGVTSIGDEAFFTAWKLKKISISDSVTRIGRASA